MKVLHPRRGRPVVALAMLLGGWVAARATFVEVMQPAVQAEVLPAAHSHVVRAHVLEAAQTLVSPVPGAGGHRAETSVADTRVIAAPVSGQLTPPLPVATVPLQLAPAPLTPPSPVAAPEHLSPRMAAGHQLLWMAAVSQMPLPPGLAAAASPPQAAPFYPARAGRQASPPRWSADGWLMLRKGGGALASGPLPASYGASQMGAVLRYHLDPCSAHRPALYLRGSAALNGSAEREAAFGLSARPWAGLPVIAAVEARATRFASGTRLRPAAMVVTELPPAKLPLGLRGEAYVQAGYVGGTGATAFADGQLKLDRRLAGVGKFELRAGAGAWGGAQKGASRLDIGPGATLGVPMGGASARLALDWRFRVAGNAAPASGPALTLSAGF